MLKKHLLDAGKVPDAGKTPFEGWKNTKPVFSLLQGNQRSVPNSSPGLSGSLHQPSVTFSSSSFRFKGPVVEFHEKWSVHERLQVGNGLLGRRSVPSFSCAFNPLEENSHRQMRC